MFIGLEDGSGVPRIFGIGMYSDVSLGVPGWVALLDTAHGIPGYVVLICGDFYSMFPSVTSVFSIIFSVGSAISVLE